MAHAMSPNAQIIRGFAIPSSYVGVLGLKSASLTVSRCGNLSTHGRPLGRILACDRTQEPTLAGARFMPKPHGTPSWLFVEVRMLKEPSPGTGRPQLQLRSNRQLLWKIPCGIRPGGAICVTT